jgi:hypothetical protein
MTKPPKRGGWGNGLASISVTLEPKQIKWLRGQKNASAVVRALIDAAMGKKKEGPDGKQ